MQGKMKSSRKQKPATGKVSPAICKVMVLDVKVMGEGGQNTFSMS